MNASDAQNKTKEWKIETKGDFCGVVGKNKTVIIPFIYDEIIRTFSSGLINVCKNEKWGCLDLDGNVVIPLKYDWIFPFGKDAMSTSNAKRNGKWGVLNRNGDEIIPCIYDEEIVFKHDIAIVSVNGKKGMIDNEGNSILPCEYSYLKPFVNASSLLKIAQNNKCGVVDTNGRIRIPAIYEEISDLRGDYLIIKQDGLWGIINLNGEIVVPFKYSKIDYFFSTGGFIS